jgi:hypothetical protein
MLPFWNLRLFLQNDAREIRHFLDVNLQLPCYACFISSNSTVFCLFFFCLLSEKIFKITAEFIITPVMLPDVIEWCAARNIVSVPGCQTPTELVNAYRHGAPLQKLFPGVAGGPAWVKAVSSALPFLSINPTSGVDLDNAGQFLEMGAASVGLVAPLFDPEAIAKGDFDQIAKNAEKVMGNVRPVGPYVRK